MYGSAMPGPLRTHRGYQNQDKDQHWMRVMCNIQCRWHELRSRGNSQCSIQCQWDELRSKGKSRRLWMELSI